jgi:hypothetical protein
MYEGRVATVDGRQFTIEREKSILTMPERFQMPQVGQFVYANTTKTGLVTRIVVRSPLRDRIIRHHQEAGVL